MNTNAQPDREKDLFAQAAEISSPAERRAFLSIACVGDPALRERLERLLAAHDDASKFLPDQPAAVPATIKIPMPPDEEKLGTMIGRYKLLEKVGEGGFGSVYVAEQREPVKRRIALKLIKLGMDTKEVVARFEAERQALAMMDHPNIAKVLDAGATESGRPYFVMELVRGIRITDYCDQNQLSTLDRLKLFIQVCNAVQHAHQKGIIHRDLKPSNILVTLHDGVPVPKVIDFGIAKATQQELTDKTVYTQLQQFIGTPAYISPEQAEMSGLDIDTRADIYSLGVLLYELLAGSTPFDARELLASGLDAMRRTIREKEPVRPSTRLTQQLEVVKVNSLPPAAGLAIPTPQEVSHDSRRRLRLKEQIALLKGDLDWIVMKCLEKDRTRRYDTANGLAADVQRHLSNEPVIARPPSTLYRFQKMARRNKLAFAATTAVLTALVLGISVSAWQAVRASRESATARRAETAARRAETLAQTEARRADDEARRAAAASTAARQSLAAADFYQATRLVDADNASEALPFLARSLSLNPTNPAARTRLFTLLNFRTWLMPRQVLTNAGHTSFAMFSPDGGRILTVSSNGEARVWDAGTEEPLTPQMNCDGYTRNYKGSDFHFGFNASGQRILSLSKSGQVEIYDSVTGRLLAVPFSVVPTNRTLDISADLNPDGTRLVGVQNFRVQVWDVLTGKPLVGPFGDEAMKSARYNSDGTKILTTSMTQHGRVWDSTSGRPVTDRFERTNVTEIAWSPDGSRIVAAYGTPPRWNESKLALTREDELSNSAQIWDATTLLPLGQKIPVEYYFEEASFSPDQRLVVISDDGRVWNATSGELASAARIRNLAVMTKFSRDGKRVLRDYIAGPIRVSDALSGQPVTEFFPAENEIHSEISPDGSRVMFVLQDGRLWMNDVRPAVCFPRLYGEPQTISLSRISPDGRTVLTVSTNSVITLWDSANGSSSVLAAAQAGMVRAEFSKDGQRILIVSGENSAQVWSAKTRQPLTSPNTYGAGIAALSFSPDGEWVATVTTNRIVTVVNALSGKEVWHKAGGFSGTAPRFSPDGRWLTVGISNYVFDAITGTERPTPTQLRSWGMAQFSPEGTRFLLTDPAAIRVYDTTAGVQVLREIKRDLDFFEASSFSQDGQQILFHTYVMRGEEGIRSALELCDADSGLQLTDPFKDKGSLSLGQLTLDGRWLVTASTNGQACLWNISPPPGALPGWLPDLLEALSGKVLNAHGVLEPTHRDPAQLLATLRTQSAVAPPTDEWSAWLRWFLADRATRGPYPLTP